jgi:bacterioferritin-associated ferredoxin
LATKAPTLALHSPNFQSFFGVQRKYDQFAFRITHTLFFTTLLPMIVCVCHRVSDKEIALLASEGKSFNDVQLELGVATQCGKCEDCARDLIDQCHAQASMTLKGWTPIAVSHSR